MTGLEILCTIFHAISLIISKYLQCVNNLVLEDHLFSESPCND